MTPAGSARIREAAEAEAARSLPPLPAQRATAAALLGPGAAAAAAVTTPDTTAARGAA